MICALHFIVHLCVFVKGMNKSESIMYNYLNIILFVTITN